MPVIDLSKVVTTLGCGYPPPFDTPCLERKRSKLGDYAGVTQFGVNLLELPPGQWSSQRHWHSSDDEFVYVLKGTVVLVTDDGEQVLTPGHCAGFPAGVANGHHIQNRSAEVAWLLEVGTRSAGRDATTYGDIDLARAAGSSTYTRKDGSAFEQ